MSPLDKMCLNYYNAGKRAAIKDVKLCIETYIEFNQSITAESLLAHLTEMERESPEIK